MKIRRPKKRTWYLHDCQAGDRVKFPDGFYNMGGAERVFIVAAGDAVYKKGCNMRTIFDPQDGRIIEVNDNFKVRREPVQITNIRTKDNMQALKYVKPGVPVQFDKIFNGNYPPNELFVVVDCGSYEEYNRSLSLSPPAGKVAVMSIACGKLSFVDPKRKVVEMNVEVNVNGPAQ